jgi:TolB-like protein/tetratricopeptide (TPR) repeat protein
LHRAIRASLSYSLYLLTPSSLFLTRPRWSRKLSYKFEDYSLDADRRELRRGSSLVTVTPQVFDVLEYLVRNHDRIVAKDDLFADVWDGRAVSDSTLSSRLTAVRHAVGDNGREQRLIRTVSRRGFRFVGAVEEEREPPRDATHFAQIESALPEKPAIAVLPFANVPHGPEQEGFVSGLVEDITTALSQFPWLSVIARSSSFTYKGWAVDIKHVGRDLGVHYVLEGSVRETANRVRVTARLLDTRTGTHLWANRFDVWHEDIFVLQDQITVSVVGEIGPKLEQLEIERARRKQPETLDPSHCYLRGLGSIYQWTREGMSDALCQFQKAIQIDPEFASAYGMAAYCYVQRKSYGWISDRAQERAECARLAQRASELAMNDGVALSKAAHAVASVVDDVDSGAVLIDRALKLNPGLAAGWYVSGWIRLFLGEPETAIEHLTRAMHLSPFDPLIFKMHAAIGYAYFFIGRYDDASVMVTKAIRARPSYLTAVRGAAASHALAGRRGRAHKLMAQMHELDPALRVSNLSDLIPFRRSEHFLRWADALRKAGLPD